MQECMKGRKQFNHLTKLQRYKSSTPVNLHITLSFDVEINGMGNGSEGSAKI